MMTAFRQGLKEAGYVEGHNVAIEYRWAEGHYDRLPALAADLVRRQVAEIVAVGTPAALAAKAASSTIPIVILVGIDPVQIGLVAGLNRPGGNVTGLAGLTVEVAAKQLEVLHELLRTSAAVALLVNPNNPLTEPETKGVRDAARSLGLQLHVLDASTEVEIDAAFEKLIELRAGGLLVSVDAFLTSQRDQIVALAARHAVPAIYGYARVPGRRRPDELRNSMLPTPIVKSAPTPARFSRARNRQTYRSNKWQEWSLSSTSRPPRHSASPSRSRCSAAPMR